MYKQRMTRFALRMLRVVRRFLTLWMLMLRIKAYFLRLRVPCFLPIPYKMPMSCTKNIPNLPLFQKMAHAYTLMDAVFRLFIPFRFQCLLLSEPFVR